jgi:hypothetical protein
MTVGGGGGIISNDGSKCSMKCMIFMLVAIFVLSLSLLIYGLVQHSLAGTLIGSSGIIIGIIFVLTVLITLFCQKKCCNSNDYEQV